MNKFCDHMTLSRLIEMTFIWRIHIKWHKLIQPQSRIDDMSQCFGTSICFFFFLGNTNIALGKSIVFVSNTADKNGSLQSSHHNDNERLHVFGAVIGKFGGVYKPRGQTRGRRVAQMTTPLNNSYSVKVST